MADLIDRRALIKEINEQRKNTKTSYPKQHFVVGDILQCIYDAPMVEPVEIVRCKDCIGKATWYKHEFGCMVCGMSGFFIVEDNDFCSYGERRESDE